MVESNTGQDPKDEEKNPFKNVEGIDKVVKSLKEHRLTHRIFNTTVRLSFYMALFLTPSGRELLSDPQRRRLVFNREGQVGMLEGSIFNSDLYFPNTEETSLEYKSAVAGRWVAYDFYRKQEFGSKASKQLTEGRLAVFHLDEVEGHGPDDYTPTALLNIFDLTHMIHFEYSPIDEMVEKGFIRETTYREAYEKTKLYDRYKRFLLLASMDDKPLYTVTPKGNSLVRLTRDGGDKVEKRKEVGALRPVFGGVFD